MGHHRNGTDETGTARGQRESGDFRPVEIGFPCQYEPRDTYPLNAIVGFSRIIAESTDAEERQNYYDIVEANNERLLQLINEIWTSQDWKQAS